MELYHLFFQSFKFSAIVLYAQKPMDKIVQETSCFVIVGYAVKATVQEERKTQEVCHNLTHHNHNLTATATATATVAATATAAAM